MPRVLTALSVFASVVETIPGNPITCRTLVQIFEHRLPLLHLLGHFNSAPILKEPFTAKQLIRGALCRDAVFVRLLMEAEQNRSRSHPHRLSHLLAADSDIKLPLRPEVVASLWRFGRYLAEVGVFVEG